MAAGNAANGADSLLPREDVAIIGMACIFPSASNLQTYWENIVTRMRHLGIFSTFITNQPDSISTNIYRQADNVFLLNFTNENDLEIVSKATMVDVETINITAKELPPHYCLVLGKVVNDFPIVIKVRELKVRTMGETRRFFTKSKEKRVEMIDLARALQQSK